MALRMWGHLVVQTIMPAEDPVMVGTLWADTSTDQLKQCTSTSPYTFVTIGGTGASIGAHATSHQNGGSDEINVTGLSGLLADGQTPLAHKTSHQDGGSDEISVAGLSGLLADPQTALAAGSDTQVQFKDGASLLGWDA